MKQPASLLKINDNVKVINSIHACISLGDVGQVTVEYECGYGVTFEKEWLLIPGRNETVKEKRTFWFPTNALALCLPIPNSPSTGK